MPRQRRRPSAADWLCLSAAPVFALMALITAMGGGGRAALLCSEMGASPLTGMVPMYLLMAAFHLAPWFRLIDRPALGG